MKYFKIETASGATEFPQPLLRAKFPLTPGETWKVNLRENFAFNTYLYSVDGTESITVSGARMEALRITAALQTPQGIMKVSTWYVKGLGAVRQVYSLGAQSMKAELTKTYVSAPAPSTPPAAMAAARRSSATNRGTGNCFFSTPRGGLSRTARSSARERTG